MKQGAIVGSDFDELSFRAIDKNGERMPYALLILFSPLDGRRLACYHANASGEFPTVFDYQPANWDLKNASGDMVASFRIRNSAQPSV